MSHAIFLYVEDARTVSLKLYAFLRTRFPEHRLIPNIDSFIEDEANANNSVVRGVVDSNLMIAIISDGWNSAWLYDLDHPWSIALRTALAMQKPIILLNYNGCRLPDNLPDNLQSLSHCTMLDFTDSTLYDTAGELGSYIVPYLPMPHETVSNYGQGGFHNHEANQPYPGSERLVLNGISPLAFQHSLDRLATDNLQKIRGFDTLVAKYMEYGFERVQHIIYSASSVKVSETQYPTLHKMLVEAATILDMPVPEMYIILGDRVNAFTYGYTRPYIVIYTPLLDMMNEDEIMAVIAHELGHIKCNHVLYNQMAIFTAPLVSGLMSNIPIVGTFVKAGFDLTFQLSLLMWSRRSELSADRASLLVMQDPEPCISMLAKLAGGSLFLKDELSLEAFIEQAKSYEIDEEADTMDKLYRFWAFFMGQSTHPFPVERAHYLNEWIGSVEYDQILQGNYLRFKAGD